MNGLVMNRQKLAFKPLGQLSQLAKSIDLPMIMAVVALLSIGFIMVSSASLGYAEHNNNNAFHYVLRHFIYLMMGVGLFAVVVLTPVDFWYRHRITLLFIAAMLLVVVLIPGIGRRVNGAQRWIPLGFITVQVSELAKLAMIVFMAGYLEKHQQTLRENWKEVGKPLGILLLFVALLILEPDFGSVVVLTGTVMGMLFVAGVRLWQFILLIAAGGGLLASLVVISPYRIQRLITFLDPWADQYNSGYQLTQSLMAFGRGEYFGVGLGKSVQKLFYLPEAHTDFVFAIFAEEFGFVGVLVVVAIFVVLISRILKMALQAVRREYWFGAYVCFGVAILMAAQAFINMGVTSGMLPTKGLTLPFISYGGSSLLVCCVMAGLVLRIGAELNGVTTPASPLAKIRGKRHG